MTALSAWEMGARRTAGPRFDPAPGGRGRYSRIGAPRQLMRSGADRDCWRCSTSQNLARFPVKTINVMTTITVGRRGQITIPKEIRRSLQWGEGDRIAFVHKGADVVLQPIRGSLMDYRGSVPVEGEQDFAAIRRQVLVSAIRADEDDAG